MPSANDPACRTARPPSVDNLAGSPAPADLDFERFEQLFRRWYRPVVRLCRTRLGSSHDAEAVAQEAFLRAWLSWHTYAQDRPFRPWVTAIAVRLCNTEYATRTRREAVAARTCMNQPVVVGEDAFQQAVVRHGVDGALRSLSPRARRLVMLRDVEGWSYEEIAAFERTTVESVRAVLRRARSTFRHAFQEIAGAPVAVAASGPGWLERLGTRLQATMRRRWGHWAPEPVVAVLSLLVAPPLATAAHVAEPVVAPAWADAGAGAGHVPAPAVGEAQRPSASTGVVEGLVSSVADSLEAGTVPTAIGVEAPSPIHDGLRYTFTASPSFAQDRTVFALGLATDGGGGKCVRIGGCGILLKSTDGGRTWTRLRGDGLSAGRILLPPDYPRDPRIFAAPPPPLVDGLLTVSHDGGATFTSIAVPRGAVTMSPSFGRGDSRILLAGSVTYPVPAAYDDEAGRVGPFLLPVPAGFVPVDFAFASGMPGADDLVVSALVPRPELGPNGVPRYTSALFRCTGRECRALVEAPSSGPVQLVRSTAPDGPFFAWGDDVVYRGAQDASSVDALAAPGRDRDESLFRLTADAEGRLFALTRTNASLGTRVYSSTDAGTSWTLLAALDGWTNDDLTVLPDGTMLMSPSGVTAPRFACSIDGGITWAPHCAVRH